MKTFNRFIGGLFLVLGMASISHAGVSVSPKESAMVGPYTTNCSTITPTVSTNAVANAAYQPGAVYEVNMSTGASAEFVVLFDSASCTGLTAFTQPSTLAVGTDVVGSRFMFGSTTATTQWKVDPPIVFHNGLCACDSAATGSSAVTYELGRGLSGQ